MLHRKTICHGAAIVREPRLRMGVPREHCAIRFINPLHNPRAAIQARFSLREYRRRGDQSGKYHYKDYNGEESQFANQFARGHGASLQLKYKRQLDRPIAQT